MSVGIYVVSLCQCVTSASCGDGDAGGILAGVTGHCGAEVFAGRIVHVCDVSLRGSRLRAERCIVRQRGREAHGRVAIEGIIGGERCRNLMIGERARKPVGAAAGGGQRVAIEGVCEVVRVYRSYAGNVGNFQFAAASYQHQGVIAQRHGKTAFYTGGIRADEGKTGILISVRARSLTYRSSVSCKGGFTVACHACDRHGECSYIRDRLRGIGKVRGTPSAHVRELHSCHLAVDIWVDGVLPTSTNLQVRAIVRELIIAR